MEAINASSNNMLFKTSFLKQASTLGMQKGVSPLREEKGLMVDYFKYELDSRRFELGSTYQKIINFVINSFCWKITRWTY